MSSGHIELRQMVQSIPAKPTQAHVTNTHVWQSIKDATSRNMLGHNVFRYYHIMSGKGLGDPYYAVTQRDTPF